MSAQPGPISQQTQAPQAQKQQVSGAHAFLQSLQAEGVDTVFGLPGGVILPIYDAMPEYPLRHVLVRHEQCAVHMAEGYAKATGKVGVALATSGPGATNTITGLTDAYYDSVPIVVFTGNVHSELLGNDAFQEADIVGMTRACTKHNVLVRHVDELAAAIKEAFHIASTGRPGPVLVDIPKDVLLAKTDTFPYEDIDVDLPGYCVDEHYSDEDLDDALALLKDAKSPVILAGGGVVNGNAHQELLAFAERFNIPVGSTLMGLGGFPTQHPQFMGFTGMHGMYWANIAIAKADTLFVIGSRLGDRSTGKADRFARNARIVHIDLDPTSLQKNLDAMVPIQGNVKAVLQQLLEKSQDMAPYADSLNSRQDWYNQIKEWKGRRAETPEYPEGFMPAERVIERIFAHVPEDGIVTTEVGQHQMWAAQKYNLNRPKSFITSGGLGTMGFGFPAAIGAQAAFPDKTVVDIAGDGSFQMVLQEMATAMDQKLPVKVCVINNHHLGMIRQWQNKMFNGINEAQMTNPDYVKLAEAYGAKGFVVKHPDEMDGVLNEAFAIMDRPVIIDFHVHEESDVYPWVPTGKSNEEMWTGEETPESANASS